MWNPRYHSQSYGTEISREVLDLLGFRRCRIMALNQGKGKFPVVQILLNTASRKDKGTRGIYWSIQ